MEQTTILLNLIIYIILGITSGLFIKFIDFCFNDGNIFDFYYAFVLWVETKSKKLAKVMGLCSYCYGFWVGTFLFILYQEFFKTEIGFIYFIPYISVVEYVIHLLFKGDD